MPAAETTLSPKQDVHRLLDSLPDSVTWDEIEYAVHVLARIRAGIDDSNAGRIVTSEEARVRMKPWLAE